MVMVMCFVDFENAPVGGKNTLIHSIHKLDKRYSSSLIQSESFENILAHRGKESHWTKSNLLFNLI